MGYFESTNAAVQNIGSASIVNLIKKLLYKDSLSILLELEIEKRLAFTGAKN